MPGDRLLSCAMAIWFPLGDGQQGPWCSPYIPLSVISCLEKCWCVLTFEHLSLCHLAMKLQFSEVIGCSPPQCWEFTHVTSWTTDDTFLFATVSKIFMLFGLLTMSSNYSKLKKERNVCAPPQTESWLDQGIPWRELLWHALCSFPFWPEAAMTDWGVLAETQQIGLHIYIWLKSKPAILCLSTPFPFPSEGK